jgi:hypothetical protein
MTCNGSWRYLAQDLEELVIYFELLVPWTLDAENEKIRETKISKLYHPPRCEIFSSRTLTMHKIFRVDGIYPWFINDVIK